MKAHLNRVFRIWDQAPHNAFTDLAHFQGAWFCTFREAQDHMSSDGRIRIITSSNGQEWTSAGLLTSPDPSLPDLRDPKIGITPDHRLMLMGAATSREENAGRRNYVWYSSDGVAWSDPVLMSEDSVWIWSFAGTGNAFYGVGYGSSDGDYEITLYHGPDALHVEKLTTLYSDALYPNETALLMEGNDGLAIIRREFAPGQTKSPPYNNGTALLATSQAPFINWETRDLDVYVGGPALLRLPDGRVIVGGRKVVADQHYMALWELDVENARLTELMVLPSANDCSYPGMVWHEDRLWVSYYSGHEGKSSIYLAEIQIS